MRLSLAQSRQPLAKSQPRLGYTPPLDERRAHPGWVAAIVVLTACLFCTMALSFTPIFLVCMRTVPTRSLRMATGMMNLMRGLASVAGIAGLSIALEHRQRYHFQVLAQEQSQYTLEIVPFLDHLYQLWLGQGDWPGLASHKAMALLSGRLHTEAALLAYQECYLGLAQLYVLLVFLVWGLHPRYTVPELVQPASE